MLSISYLLSFLSEGDHFSPVCLTALDSENVMKQSLLLIIGLRPVNEIRENAIVWLYVLK